MMKNVSLGYRKSAGAAARQALSRSLCTEAETTGAAGPQEETRRNRRLYKRLSELGAKKGLVGRTINEYLREGRVARKDDLMRCIKELRRFGRHHQALEVTFCVLSLFHLSFHHYFSDLR